MSPAYSASEVVRAAYRLLKTSLMHHDASLKSTQ